MGMWAFAPWDNDEAADWFGDLMDATQIRKQWLQGIRADPAESPEVVRAAAALFVMLGRIYVWPVKTFSEDLELAIAALAEARDSDAFAESPEVLAAIDLELAELRARRKPAGAPDASPTPPSRPWWKLW